MWAYGMTVVQMMELVVRGRNIGNKVQVVFNILRGSECSVTGEITKRGFEGLRIMCQACWHPENDSVPSMDEVVKAFSEDRLVRCMHPSPLRRLTHWVSQSSLKQLAVESHLRRTLQGYREADLTGKVVQLEEYNRNHGGFSDVYYGRSTIHDKLVAIKRVRYRLHDDLQFIKVFIGMN